MLFEKKKKIIRAAFLNSGTDDSYVTTDKY